MKRISRNFDIRNPRSGQFCDLSIISQWEKNERCLFWTKTIQNPLKHRAIGRLETLSRNIVTGDPSSCHQGALNTPSRILWEGHLPLMPPPLGSTSVYNYEYHGFNTRSGRGTNFAHPSCFRKYLAPNHSVNVTLFITCLKLNGTSCRERNK